MADTLRLWFDAEADYLEVQFHEGSGYMRETAHDAVMERVDSQGNILGFSILGVSKKGTDLFIENWQAVFVADLAACRWSSYGVRFDNREEEWLDDDPCHLGFADSEKKRAESYAA
jgi:hypothetical protein